MSESAYVIECVYVLYVCRSVRACTVNVIRQFTSPTHSFILSCRHIARAPRGRALPPCHTPGRAPRTRSGRSISIRSRYVLPFLLSFSIIHFALLDIIGSTSTTHSLTFSLTHSPLRTRTGGQHLMPMYQQGNYCSNSLFYSLIYFPFRPDVRIKT